MKTSRIDLNNWEEDMKDKKTPWPKVWHVCTCAVLATGIIFGMAQNASTQDQLDRTTLPIQQPEHKPITVLDARDAAALAWVTLSRTSFGLSAAPAMYTPLVGVSTGRSFGWASFKNPLGDLDRLTS